MLLIQNTKTMILKIFLNKRELIAESRNFPLTQFNAGMILTFSSESTKDGEKGIQLNFDNKYVNKRFGIDKVLVPRGKKHSHIISQVQYLYVSEINENNKRIY